MGKPTKIDMSGFVQKMIEKEKKDRWWAFPKDGTFDVDKMKQVKKKAEKLKIAKKKKKDEETA